MYPILDLHCDIIYALAYGEARGNLEENDGHTDLRWMEKAGKVTTAFALFVPLEHGISPWDTATMLHTRFIAEIASSHGRIQQVRTALDIENNPVQGALLSCEELQILEGDLSRIQTLSSWGVRMATLIWNNENDLAYPNQKEGGLKSFGFEAVQEMERHGILVDVSHLNDEGFFDLVGIAKKPFIASHSNCRSVTNHSRNLSDRMIHSIAERGGVVGLNFCPSFLSEDWEKSSMEAIIKHVVHLKRVGGTDILALGTDFDGISGSLEIDHYSKFDMLWNALEKKGFSTSELEKMWYLNALRVLS